MAGILFARKEYWHFETELNRTTQVGIFRQLLEIGKESRDCSSEAKFAGCK